MPAIAVVMPVWNRAERVGEAIASVLAQDFADFELIVVDDGSTDGTAGAVEAVADPRLRLLRQPERRGGNAARNRGVRAAESPLVAFLDSDDSFLPHKLGFLVRWFAANPDTGALVDSFRLVYPPESGRAPVERINPALSTGAEIERAVFSRRLYKATPAISARREALLAAGLFDESLTRRQDMDLILRLARTVRCAAIPEVLWVKRWSPGSISAKQESFAAAAIEICARHPDYLTRREYRAGLARDIARHFLRLAATGRLRTVRADLVRCGAYFGWPRTAALMGGGLVEMARRAGRRT